MRKHKITRDVNGYKRCTTTTKRHTPTTNGHTKTDDYKETVSFSLGVVL